MALCTCHAASLLGFLDSMNKNAGLLQSRPELVKKPSKYLHPATKIEQKFKACRAQGYNLGSSSWPTPPSSPSSSGQGSSSSASAAAAGAWGRPAEWQSACAVLSGQWVSALSEEEKHASSSNDHARSSKLEARPTIGRDLVTLPRPLSVVQDLASNLIKHDGLLRVAYQGVPGAYSEAAAWKAFPKCEAVPCEQFDTAFQAVELWLVDRAVLPIENSLGGTIHRNYDLLLRHRLHIVGEVQLAVRHCLMALPGVEKKDLKRVISHQQALAQCEHNLSKLGVTREAVDDTAGAAQFIVAQGLRDTGAVASARAAEIYGMNILDDDIRDDSSNVTRFLMLAREPIIPRNDRPFKTSIVFSLEEGPGMLFKALSAFSLRGINLTKIESRPQRKKPLRIVDESSSGSVSSSAKHFDYLFYIDFEASMADPRSQNALGHLQEFATFLRVLGSYPIDTSDPSSP